MSRKRRMFDIDLPDEPAAEAGPRISSLGERRGPMASAVRETADSLRSRSEAEQEIRAENDALAHDFVERKSQGLVLERIPLDQIHTRKLTRDRRTVAPEALDELKASISEIGLSNPVQLERVSDGFELVQGLRRLTAYRGLDRDHPEAGYDAIAAVVLEPGESLEILYRRMVDENLVRSDISFAEMARLAQNYAADPATDAADLDAAVDVLYATVAKQKRSYIRAFARLLSVLEKHLEFPEAIPRALGLSVRKRIEAEPESLAGLQRSLASAVKSDSEAELKLLRNYAEGAEGQGAAPFPAGNRTRQSKQDRKARTTFQVRGAQGTAKCTASQGRLEIQLDEDFSAIDRRKLEKAVADLLSGLANR